MMHLKPCLAATLLASLATLYGAPTPAQTVSVFEDFNTTTTVNPWYALGDACLTASSSAGTASATTAGSPPGCVAIAGTYGENLVGGYNGVAGSSVTLPDPNYWGALRFTNGCIWTTGASNCSNGGHSQHGAIISGNTYPSNAGLQITFKTTTYRGDSGGANGDGADGMSFFLIDGSVTPNIGSWGGSLAYTCSNANSPYVGMVGGYIGLGIDEYGNFLNGVTNTLGTGYGATGDNTSNGGGYAPNRIGMRGAGNVAWSYMLAKYPSYYNTATYLNSVSNQNAAVQNTCKNGYLSTYTGASVSSTQIPIADYTAIPNANKVLTNIKIADEYASGGYSRQNATTILYRLTITPAGLLSLSYSTGGSWLGVLANQSITASNGALPASIRFGFAGSTGGSSNIHEVLCFKANSLDTSGSSAGSNLQQSAQLTSSSQAYFAYYNPNDWTGRLTANALSSNSAGVLSIATTATWDASCVLTGVASGTTCQSTGAAGPTAAEAPTSRAILSWNGSTGIPFEWTNLSTAQQNVLDPGDANAYRLNYLRGDRTQEVDVSGSVGQYRDRDSVLGDIVDSSPTAVGQPVSPYASVWKDRLVATDTMAENSGSQTYAGFFAAYKTRENVVYVGANDGLLHGFRAGSYTSANNFSSGTNDGTEVLAYMPAAVVNTIHNAGTVELDYSNTQYGHNFYVDATPGTGDLFYEGTWHTWLVGGLGVGGQAIYALDVTDPSKFSESNASSLVIGEWNPSTISCVGNSTCGKNLGNTFGTPIVRRLHNGDWAVIFGNGFGSASGDAGVYVMLVDQSSGNQSFYYLSTGKGGSGDGIAYVTSADLDGDHIVDYLYAGDLLGNVWRFDLTSGNPANWAAGSAPLFSAGSSQPITSSLVVAAAVGVPGTQVIVSFGTGQQTQLTNSTPTTYASGAQDLYAVWDWNMTAWNNLSNIKYASLNPSSSNFTTQTGLTSPYTLTPGNLTTQTLTQNATLNTVDVTASTICWAGTNACAGSDKSFGWAMALPGSNEQVIYNPELVGAAFVVNSVIPANNSILSCTSSVNSGYTYAINLLTGGVATTSSSSSSSSGSGATGNNTQNFFVQNGDPNAGGVLTNATGTSLVVTTSTSGSGTGTGTGSGGSGGPGCTGTGCTSGSGGGGLGPNPFSNVAGCSAAYTYLVYQTSSGTGAATRVAPSCPLTGQRATWTQKR